MIKKVWNGFEYICPKHLYFVEVNGQTFCVAKYQSNPNRYDYETWEESSQPEFDVFPLKEVEGDEDLKSFVQSLLDNKVDNHPQSRAFREKRNDERQNQCHQKEETDETLFVDEDYWHSVEEKLRK